MSAPAAQHKDKGNESFKAGKYPEAIGHYTAAVLADATDPTFPLNRAAAYLKLNKNEDAERDCSTVLKLQPANVKAMFRRAQARVGLKKLGEARTDLLAAAKADPGNAAIRAEFTKVEESIAEAAKKAKAPKGTPISVPTRAPGQAQVSGTPYRRRVPIAIKDDDEPPSDKKDKGKQATDSKTAPLKSILKGPSPSPDPSTSGPSKALPAATNSKDLLTPVSTRSISSAPPPDRSSVPASASVVKPAAPVQPAQQTPISTPVAQLPPASVPAAQPSSAPTATETSTIQTEPAPPSTPPALPAQPDATPPTLVVFLRKWTNTNSDGERAQILFSIPPGSIPTLFGPTLESPLLGAMLAAMSWAVTSSESPELARGRALEYMRSLARVPRFSTLVMFLDGEEKKAAVRIWDAIGGEGGERKLWGC